MDVALAMSIGTYDNCCVSDALPTTTGPIIIVKPARSEATWRLVFTIRVVQHSEAI